MFSKEKNNQHELYSGTILNKGAIDGASKIQSTDNLALVSNDDKVEKKEYVSSSERPGEEKIRNLLRKKRQSPEEVEKNVDKLYQLADAFFDLWLEGENQL